MSAVPPTPGTIFTDGSNLSNEDLYTIANSVTGSNGQQGWQQSQYGDLTAAFV